MAYRIWNKKPRKEIEEGEEGRGQNVSNVKVWRNGDQQHPKVVVAEKYTQK